MHKCRNQSATTQAMQSAKAQYADIVFPRNIDRLTYLLPPHLAGCVPGMIAEAPLRGRRARGIVVDVFSESRTQGTRLTLKPVTRTIEGMAFPASLIPLITWVSEYYLCSEGLAFKGLLFAHALEPMRKKMSLKEPVVAPVPFPLGGAGPEAQILIDAMHGKEFRALLYHSGGIRHEIALVMHLVRNMKNILLLVPETHDIGYFLPFFEEQAKGRYRVLHSRMSRTAKTEAYRSILARECDVVVGTMQTVFAPLPDLALIIVFKEQSEFYKHEETPMYNVRDVAVKRASIQQIPVLLTSRAPSFESFSNAAKDKYRLIGNPAAGRVPEVRIIYAAGSEGLITHPLRKAVHDALRDDRKVLLILNRKGYSLLRCGDCGSVSACVQCGVPMVFHAENILRCHSCGRAEDAPGRCPACGGVDLKYTSTGTEKAYAALKKEFGTTLSLIDSEHAAGRSSVSTDANIIIGTDLALRRLAPFSQFGLTAILNADIGLNRPDFRVYERFFQHALYLSEMNAEGSVMFVQTFDWKNPLFGDLKRFDYRKFYRREIMKRRAFRYPPFAKTARILLRASGMREHAPNPCRKDCELLGPVPGRSRGNYVEFLLKCGTDRPIQPCIRELSEEITDDPKALKIDIDPLVFA